MDDERVHKVVEMITDKYASEGKLVEMGWVSLLMILENSGPLPEHQREDMRMAFMAGAQHIFASIMSIISKESDEATPEDEMKLTLIHNELTVFGREMKLRSNKEAGRG
jgi:hypothetical protein